MNTFLLSKLVLVATLFVQYISSAPVNEQQANIVGGHLAKKGEYPYQAEIRSTLLSDPHVCGASIIDENHVLTAAHCCRLIIGDMKNFYIGAGVIDKSDTQHMVKRNIEKFIEHESYDYDTYQNDICLIKIKVPFIFNNFVKPVPLHVGNVNENTRCSVSGWGYWSEQSFEQPNRLKGTVVPISNQDQCVTNYTSVRTVYLDSMLCAGYPQGGTDACRGDSGGPLVCSKKLTGIVSWGKGCAEPNYPGIYTKVGNYIDWIQQHGAKTLTDNEDFNNSEIL